MENLLALFAMKNVSKNFMKPSDAASKNLELVKLLHEKISIPLDDEKNAHAAAAGLLDVLIYLRSKDCPMKNEVALQAASHSTVGSSLLR